MPTRNPDWTFDEAVLLLALYRRNPNAEAQDPGVRALSRLLVQSADLRGVTPLPTYRNPPGVAMRLRNLTGIDPIYLESGRKGLPRGPAVDRSVWAQFAEDPAALALAEQDIEARWSRAWTSNEDQKPSPSRGPVPSYGGRSTVHADGPTEVYLMQLDGPVERLLPNGHDPLLKLGLSNDVERRLAELNAGFPTILGLRWRKVRTWPCENGRAAWTLERAALLASHAAGWSLGGEFIACSLGQATALVQSYADDPKAASDRAD
jgi:hypothetical protein